MPLDIGLGLLLGILLNDLTTVPYGLCLCLGIIASLLPDLDFMWKYLQAKRVPDTSHRDGLHYPLLVVPIVSVAGWLIKPEIGLIFGLGTLLHFIHDSVGIGFGVKWLYPFSKNSYQFFYHVGLPANKNMPRKMLQSWNDEERNEIHKKYADPDWIKHIYFQLHPFGIFEYLVFVIGMLAAIIIHK